MKKINYLFAIAFIFLVISCKKDESKSDVNELLGKWKLVQIYADPGDGSGTWRTIESNKTREFKANGEMIVTNGAICLGFGSKDKEIATYELQPYIGDHLDDPTTENKKTDRYNLMIKDCGSAIITFENGHLKILFFCIEGCGELYEKIK
jgi:hypothetical protein